jgi:hypothetical protein
MADYTAQVSFKIADVLINVPLVDDIETISLEIENKLRAIADNAAIIAETQALLQAAGVAAGILGARSAPAGASQGNQGAAAASSGAPLCDCGVPRQWKEGTSKAGNNYKGFFCVNSKCKPDFRK